MRSGSAAVVLWAGSILRNKGKKKFGTKVGSDDGGFPG
jgi:hypothetical protein